MCVCLKNNEGYICILHHMCVCPVIESFILEKRQEVSPNFLFDFFFNE